ncbi:MAG: protein phosphatase 2C domain-containing protein [Pirellulales bacterium]
MTRNRIQEEHCAGGVRCAAVSDIGMRRASNQDALAISLGEGSLVHEAGDGPGLGHLFVVADGMGAHAAGELASKLATDTIPHSYSKRPGVTRVQALVDAVHDANQVIFTKGQDSVDFHGMGTTCSCLLMLSGEAFAAHVGDSRVYRLREHVLEQLTFDHSLVWELAAAGDATEEAVPAYVPKNVITRSLGPNATVRVDVEGPFPIQNNDCFLLCSDGLTGPLSNELIGIVMATLPADKAAQTLVDLANLLGGPDNITVIVAEVTDASRLDVKDATPLGIENADTNGAVASKIVSHTARSSSSCLDSKEEGEGQGWLHSLWNWLPWRDRRGQVEATSGSTGSSLPNDDRTNRGKKGGSHDGSPYRRYVCQPQAENVEVLSDIVKQLEDLEDSRDWQFDWQEIRKNRHQAYQAITRKEYDKAVVAYCSAVRRLMASLRKIECKPTSDSDIGLGFS